MTCPGAKFNMCLEPQFLLESFTSIRVQGMLVVCGFIFKTVFTQILFLSFHFPSKVKANPKVNVLLEKEEIDNGKLEKLIDLYF